MDRLEIDAAQFQSLLSAVNSMRDHAPFWKPAVPIFLAAMLGLGSALLLDWLKTRREKRKVTRERLEKELAQLSGVNTAIAFNIESLIHIIMQQILPHHAQSHAAAAAMQGLKKTDATQLEDFDIKLHSDFESMMRRCPEPYFIEIDLFKDFHFLLVKDSRLVGTAGWMITFSRNLKAILSERNRLIDSATLGEANGKLDLEALERTIATQANIANVEIVNSHQLLTTFMDATAGITAVIGKDYKDVLGAKLKIQLPAIAGSILEKLEQVSKPLVPDLPPPEPQPLNAGASDVAT